MRVMSIYLDKLKWLYLHVPNIGYGTAADLRKIFNEYIVVLSMISASHKKYRIATSGLCESVTNMHDLISSVAQTNFQEDKDRLMKKASTRLRDDIKSLIEIVEIKPEDHPFQLQERTGILDQSDRGEDDLTSL
jgi:hypothetical protein